MSGLPRQSGGPQQLKTGADVLSGSPISPQASLAALAGLQARSAGAARKDCVWLQPSSAQLPPSNEILLLRTRLQELEKRAARTPTLEQHQQLEAKLQDLEHKLKQLEHKLLEETQSQSSKSGQEVSSASQPAASALYPPLPRVSPSPAPTAFAGKKAVSRCRKWWCRSCAAAAPISGS